MMVVKEVVANNWCVGCGMCSALCPKKRLNMQWNERGEYNPVEISGSYNCGNECSLCYDVCPAHGKRKNETEIGFQLYGNTEGINHRKETGYYFSSYVGYSKYHRAEGASGGMATWFLEELFSSNKVDAVIAVGRKNNSEKLFEFKKCQSVEEIRRCSRSVYYPVEISCIIKDIINNAGIYAFIGLPCVCKAIRLAQEKNPKLKNRIKYLIGLTCNHQCSKYFSEYICALAGGKPNNIKSIVFRGKDVNQPAANLKFIICSVEEGKEINRKIYWWDGVGKAFTNGYFQIPGCFYCDDVFAECADICFMDAWLPEYKNDSRGTSLLIVRRGYLDPLFSKLSSVKSINIKDIIASQRSVIEQKQYRRRARKNRFRVLREEIQKRPMLLMEKIMNVKKAIAEDSSQHWHTGSRTIEEFNKKMQYKKKRLDKLRYRQKWVRLPSRIYNWIHRQIKG